MFDVILPLRSGGVETLKKRKTNKQKRPMSKHERKKKEEKKIRQRAGIDPVTFGLNE